MSTIIETNRLILREIRTTDTGDMYLLDSDASVHTYLGNNPITCMGKARSYVDHIKMQYEKYGIGRWATIEKKTGKWIGWSGLKFNFEKPMNGHINFYDIGYRFMPAFWGKGYATESAMAAKEYFVKKYPQKKLYGMAEVENRASRKVLQKIGLKEKNTFTYDSDKSELVWYEL